MNKNQDPASILNDPNAVSQVAKSPDARALRNILTQGHSEDDLQRIAQEAAKGNTQELKKVVSSLMQDPGSAAIIARLQKQFGGK